MVNRVTARATRRQCFVVARRIAPLPLPPPLDLPDRAAEALARLLPVLGCGEEAAAVAFDGLAALQPDSDKAAADLLLTIAAEERIHDALLWQLRAGLPDPALAEHMLAATRQLHLALSEDGPVQHFARIAALDSALCLVLGRMLRQGTPISQDRISAPVLRRIQQDEARHVRVSRMMVHRAGVDPMLRGAAARARAALADVLALAAAEFEALAVDPAWLDCAVRRLPDGLLA